MNQTIFVIDDEISITDSVQFALEQEGFDVRVFHTGQEVMPALENGAPELLILDVGLTDGSGFDFFSSVSSTVSDSGDFFDRTE